MDIRDLRPPTHQLKKRSFSGGWIPIEGDKYEMAHPGLSGPGGMVMGSAPCHESNLLIPDEINSVRFSFLKIWSSVSTRHTTPEKEAIDILLRFRPDPSGALQLGGDPLVNVPEYMSVFVAEKEHTEVERTWVQDPETLEMIETTEIPTGVTDYRVMYIVTNHPEEELLDNRTLYEKMLPNGSECPVTVCLMCGEPTDTIRCVTLNKLMFGIDVPQPKLPGDDTDQEDTTPESYITISEELGAEDIVVETRVHEDPEADPLVPLGYAELKFTLPLSYFKSNPEHIWKCHFLIKIGDRSATLPEVLFVGPDKSKFHEHPGGDSDWKQDDHPLEPPPPIPDDPAPGNLTWNPYTIYQPLVVGGKMKIDKEYIVIGNNPPEYDTATPDNKYGG